MSSPRPGGSLALKYSQQYRRCGRPDCPTCTPPGRGHGPYWYAYWWEQGRVRSRYLGKELPSSEPVLQALAPPGRAGSSLRVRTLGGFAVWRGGTPVPAAQWGRKKAVALFKALLGAPGYQLHREQLLDLLLPEAEPAEAARTLRSTLYLLRRVVDIPGAPASHVQTRGELLTLQPVLEGEPADDWLDAAAFARSAREALAKRDQGLCRAALALYTGEYLPEDRYEPWAERQREELASQHLAVLLCLADLSRAVGEREEALRCLRTVLAADPCHEDAARDLMVLLAAEGRRGEALEVYRTLASALEEELGEAPGRETRAVRARLLAEAPAVLLPTARRTNLPAAFAGFVGREWERAEVARLLEANDADRRLVTLVGAGGCGKTRLALEVARGLLADYADGVWLAELATLDDSALLAPAVATALGLAEDPHRPALDQLTAYLAPKHMLLVLDNCEHLVAASAALAASLLQAAPALHLLVTSQVALGVLGEHIWRVPSLSLPERDGVPAADLVAFEAVQLFLERSRAIRPGFSLSERNAPAVLQVCRRLDGIPLAIELAAARLTSLSVEQLAARLDDRFALLTAGNRAALPRQQTLHATIAWSVGLLSSGERLLLQRLAVFVGGWSLEAAEAVCSGHGLPERSVLEQLDGLVARSLVQVEEHEEAPRYRLLETVRLYALEIAVAPVDLETVRERHLAWYLALAEQAAAQLRGMEEGRWLSRLETDHDNLRAALRRTRERGESERGLRLVAMLWRFWAARGHLSEGRAWLEAALAVSGPSAAAIRASALDAGGQLAYRQGDYERAVELHEESLRLFRELQDKTGMSAALGHLGRVAHLRGAYARAWALSEESLVLAREVGRRPSIAAALQRLGNASIELGDYAQAARLLDEGRTLFRSLGDKYGIAATLTLLGIVAQQQGDCAHACALYEESLALYRELDDTYGIANALLNLGHGLAPQGEYARATSALEQSLELSRKMGDRHSIAIALSDLGIVADLQGEYARAAGLHEESLSLSRELGNRHGIAGSLGNLGLIAFRQGHNRRAVALLQESLTLNRDLGTRGEVAQVLECLAWAAVVYEQPRRAARLGGAAEALRQSLSMPLRADLQAGHEAAAQAMRATLGEAALAAAWAEGCVLPLDSAVDLALQAPQASVPD